MDFSLYPSSSQGFPTFFHHFPMGFPVFSRAPAARPARPACGPRSGDPKGTLLRGHRGLGAEDAPRGAHVARAGRSPGIPGGSMGFCCCFAERFANVKNGHL